MSFHSGIVFVVLFFSKMLVVSSIQCIAKEYCQFEKYPTFCSPLPIAVLYVDGPSLFNKFRKKSYLSHHRYLSYLNIFGNVTQPDQSCMVASDLTYSGFVGIKLRGRSSRSLPKSQFSVKTYGNVTREKIMAAKVDWIYTSSNGGDYPQSSSCVNFNIKLHPNVNCSQRTNKKQCLRPTSGTYLCEWKPNNVFNRPYAMPKKKKTKLMGKASGENWIFHAPGIFDKSLMRNFLAYKMARDSNQYASRTQFFELFIVAEYDRPEELESKVPSIDITMPMGSHHQQDYRGIYLLCESPKSLGPNRIHIAKMREDNGFNVERGADGGYVLEYGQGYDSVYTYDKSIPSFMGDMLHVVYPKMDKITLTQLEYIQKTVREWDDFFKQHKLLPDKKINNPLNPSKLVWLRYRDFIDIDSWALYILHMEISRNQDGFSNSFYLHKQENSNISSCPRNKVLSSNCIEFEAHNYFGPPLPAGTFGKWIAGPVWDYNLAYANSFASPSVSKINGWKLSSSSAYWRKFVDDPLFVDRMIILWTSMRKSKWSNKNIANSINDRVLLLTRKVGLNSPLEREIKVNGGLKLTSFQEEIRRLQEFVHARMSWIDENICSLYRTKYDRTLTGLDSLVPTHSNEKNSKCTKCIMGECVCGLCVCEKGYIGTNCEHLNIVNSKTVNYEREVRCNPNAFPVQFCPSGDKCTTSLTCTSNYCICPSTFAISPIILPSSPPSSSPPPSSPIPLSPTSSPMTLVKPISFVKSDIVVNDKTVNYENEVHCDPNTSPMQVCPSGDKCTTSLTCTPSYCICPSKTNFLKSSILLSPMSSSTPSSSTLSSSTLSFPTPSSSTLSSLTQSSLTRSSLIRSSLTRSSLTRSSLTRSSLTRSSPMASIKSFSIINDTPMSDKSQVRCDQNALPIQLCPNGHECNTSLSCTEHYCICPLSTELTKCNPSTYPPQFCPNGDQCNTSLVCTKLGCICPPIQNRKKSLSLKHRKKNKRRRMFSS